MVPKVNMTVILLLSLLSLTIGEQHKSSKCSEIAHLLSGPFTCGNEYNGCNELIATNECSIYCCPNNITTTFASSFDADKMLSNVTYIKDNIAQSTFDDYIIEIEEPMNIQKRASCDPNSATAAGGNFKRDTTNVNAELTKIETRATKNCANCGRIKRAKYGPVNCNPYYSRGYRSAHNCYNSNGKSYLCVQSGIATCYRIGEARSKNFENGECFL